MKVILVIAMLFLATMLAPVQAADHVTNYDIVSDVLKTDEACRAGQPEECAHFADLCEVITPELNSKLVRYMRNEPPFRTRNGGSNITNRWPIAMDKCHSLNI